MKINVFVFFYILMLAVINRGESEAQTAISFSMFGIFQHPEQLLNHNSIESKPGECFQPAKVIAIMKD